MMSFSANSAILQFYYGENKLIFNDMMMRSALYKTNTLSWKFSVSSLKQQSANRHVTTIGHISMIPIRFFLFLLNAVFRGKATKTNFIVFGLTQSGLKSTIYRTRGEHPNHYATDAVMELIVSSCISLLNTSCFFMLGFPPKSFGCV